MAVINNDKAPSAALQAFTAAALALPGLVPLVEAADAEPVNFQYGHYQEGKRDLGNVQSNLNPIEADSLLGSVRLKFSDRLKAVFNFTQDTWSGATPVTTAPIVAGGNQANHISSGASPLLEPRAIALDANNTPYRFNPVTGVATPATQLVHTLSSASPETRKQGDMQLTYEWDNAEMNGGAGVSHENDYQSVFGNIGGRLDFRQKTTSLNFGLNFTSSETRAVLDHDATPYIYEASKGLSSYNSTHSTSQLALVGVAKDKVLSGEREDWGARLGLTQILNKSALVQADFAFTQSTGYLDNPYKAVTTVFVDPSQTPNGQGLYIGDTRALLEKRPDERNQWQGSLRYIQHVAGLDAALHFNYRLAHDDWGITAHTFEADWVQPIIDGWVVTPRIRYYSQDAADFYTPFLVSKQTRPGKPQFDSAGNLVAISALNPGQIPANYSSDHRLSGFGALSGGVTLSKKFAKGIGLEIGAEYYTHAGSLKLGGGGEGAYADFSSFLVNAALKVDFAALAMPMSEHAGHGQHQHAHHMHSSHAPAGVMFEHMLPKAGDMMVGYRYMYMPQNGPMLRGSDEVADATIIKSGCQAAPCYMAPEEMNMHMHMLDLMYAPTDWLTLMLMPQFVDMNMTFRGLNGASTPPIGSVTDAAVKHAEHPHATGGVGDTGLYALFKVFEQAGHHLHATLGFSAPTGDVGIKLRNTHQEELGFIHYAMQLGSGTWDFKPSITYTGHQDDWSWGAQISGTKRLQSQNASGFAFGDMLQTTAWGSYQVLHWLSASVRGVYSVQGQLQGAYNGTYAEIGTMDYASNYGGRFGDIGFGLQASVPSGEFMGNSLSFEWLQPVHDDVNGYQLPRDPSLFATWSYMF